MNKVFSAFFGVIGAVALSGCCMMLEEAPQPKIREIVERHQQQVNRTEELNILCGKAWVPVYIKGQEGVDGKNAITLPADVQAYLEFKRDGKITGFAGVNVFNGSFAVTAPDRLRFGALVTTLQAGPHLDYEMLFMAQLNDVDHFVIAKDGKIDFMKRNMLMMRCKPVDLKLIKRSKPQGITPVPPEVKGGVAPGNAVNAQSNPALPTVEKSRNK